MTEGLPVEELPLPTPPRTARRFKIVIGVAVVLVLAWTALWYVGRHYAETGLASASAKLTADGGSLDCGAERTHGFPFRLTMDCAPFTVNLPAHSLSFALPGAEAITLLYNPGHAIAAAKGPLTLAGPEGLAVTANWKSLESSVNLGVSKLKRFSLAGDAIAATITAPSHPDLPSAVAATHAELHLTQEDQADALGIWVSSDGLTESHPDQPTLPPANLRIHVILPGALQGYRSRPQEWLAAWEAAGRKIAIDTVGIEIGGFAAMTTGALTVDDSGLISGALTVRVDQMEKLPALVEMLRPGKGEEVAKIIGPLGMMMKPVTIDGKTWREVRLSINKGRVGVGFIPLGKIPPLKLPAAAAEG